MRRPHVRPPRLLVFVWFIAAAGVLAGGLLVRALDPGAPRPLDLGWELGLASLVCAFFVGRGFGEWRGLRYAERLLASERGETRH